MKICPYCSNQIQDNVTVCPVCGYNLYPQQNNVNYNNQQNNQNYNNPQMNYQNNGFNQDNLIKPVQVQNIITEPTPNPATQKKQKKNISIIFIIFSVVAIIAIMAVGMYFNMSDDDEDYYNKYDTYEDESVVTEPVVYYSKGTIVNGVYENEWANIRFNFGEDYPVLSEDLFAEYENSNTECGFASLNELEGNRIIIAFYDLSSFTKTYTESDYLDAIKKAVSEDADYYEFVWNEEYKDITVAGETYKYAMGHFPESGVYACECVRIKDDHVIEIMVNDVSEENIFEILNLIQPY